MENSESKPYVAVAGKRYCYNYKRGKCVAKENPLPYDAFTIRHTRIGAKQNGIDLAEYNRLFKVQGGKCAVCDIHQSEHEHALVVDHDHITKEVRGLLCHKCNRGLGLFDDNLEKMAQAIKYLKKAKKCQL